MSEIDNLLSAVFYRHSCPEVETLGDYASGVLPPGQRLAVAQHLRVCPLCTRELAGYAADDESPGGALAEMLENIKEGLRNVVGRVTWAELVAPSPSVAIRGDGDTLRYYRAGDIQVIMAVQPASTGHKRKRLLGKVEPAAAAIGADLWGGAELVDSCEVASDGHFSFDRLQLDAYTLCLRQAEAEVWLEVTGLTD